MVVSSALEVSLDRLKADLSELGEIGRDPEDHGIYRMSFSEADLEARRWLSERIEDAGLELRQDGAGNITGVLRPEDSGAAEQPAVVMGSHIDTVPCAGMLDGSLGVVAALECLRVLGERRGELKRPVEMIAFSDEEGRFGGGMFGSEAFCGHISPEHLYATDRDGVTLRDAMQACGLDPDAALEARRDPRTISAYLELHIEQGPVLFRGQHPVGIVDRITGLFRWRVRFRGESNHAGTTPMDMRRDAFMGLADFAHEIPRLIDENGSDRTRVTVGRAEILPGAANTVPGRVEFSLDVRDTDAEILDELRLAMRKALSAIARRRDLMVDLEFAGDIKPVGCEPSLLETLKEVAAQLELDAPVIPSGAAHDAQIIASIAPVAMVFVPSRGGISHSPQEWTDWGDIEAGANLSLNTLRRLVSA